MGGALDDPDYFREQAPDLGGGGGDLSLVTMNHALPDVKAHLAALERFAEALR
ncbi:MAG: hypothetical protein R3E53_10915 [Myxococcota bacterium]